MKPLPLLLFICFFTAARSSDDETYLVSELLSLRSKSNDGVIRLDDHSASRFLTSTKLPRPYSLLIFFDAAHLHDKYELHLQDLRRELSLLSFAFIANNVNNTPALSKLFVCETELRDSQSLFQLFGVNSLPHIRLVGPNVRKMREADKMDQGDIASVADSMADFIESKIKVTIGPINRPPFLSKTQMTMAVAGLLIWAPFLAKKVLSGETLLHNAKMWSFGAVFIYFFSVSGSMHNIIRKMPMFTVDRNDHSKLVFFYQGSGMQFGAEGFTVGLLYTTVGLLLALITHLLVKLKKSKLQMIIMIAALLVSFRLVVEVVYLDNWKTGYAIHPFWPSSWN